MLNQTPHETLTLLKGCPLAVCGCMGSLSVSGWFMKSDSISSTSPTHIWTYTCAHSSTYVATCSALCLSLTHTRARARVSPSEMKEDIRPKLKVSQRLTVRMMRSSEPLFNRIPFYLWASEIRKWYTWWKYNHDILQTFKKNLNLKKKEKKKCRTRENKRCELFHSKFIFGS